MTRVFAVIVTYKRPEMLRTCMQHLVDQRRFGLATIHVVLNSHDQETFDVVKSFSMRYEHFISYEMQDNVGPAGGHHRGLKKFLGSHCEYAWLMDDDVIVKPFCLKELLEGVPKYHYIYPRVIKKSGEEVVSYGWWGVLLSKSLVIEAGLPLMNLFYWAEDTEYLQNRIIRVHGFKLWRCKNAVVEHLHQRGEQIPSWQYYYKIRNTLYYRIFIQKNNRRGRIKRTFYLFLYVAYRILIKEKRKFLKLRLVILGTYHGIKGKLGKLIDPETCP